MKQLYIILLLSLVSSSLYCQNVQKGDSFLSPHIGLIKEAGDPATPNFPAIFLSYEYMIADSFSIGVIGGYESATLEGDFTGIDTKRTRIFAGGILNLHIINSNKLNGYLGGKLGYEDSSNNITSGGLLYDAHAGLRIFLGNSFAVFGEAGLGYAPIRVGVSFKF